VNSSRDGMIDAAHDLSEGGLAAALSEAALRFGVGARIGIDELCERDGIDPFTALFSESQGRAIVSVPRSEEVRFNDMCTARNYPALRIGVVDTENQALDVQGHFTLPLAELKEAHEGNPAEALRLAQAVPDRRTRGRTPSRPARVSRCLRAPGPPAHTGRDIPLHEPQRRSPQP
jgi:phosphoribosylformylglycinamidine synthase